MREHGVRGLWRGVTGAIPRCTVGSATQLSTFSMAKQYMDNTKVLKYYTKRFEISKMFVSIVKNTLYVQYSWFVE